MDLPVILLLISFVALLALGTPVAVSIGLATLITMASLGDVPALFLVSQRIAGGISSFPLLAIPFFILSGILMGEGGMARRLMAFAEVLVGGFRGGLSYVTTVTCMLFGSVSGSATAAVSSVGGFMIPEMVRQGYKRPYSVAVTTTAATTGLLIPPSNIMIVYAVAAGNVSVAALFMAGVVPGLLMGGFLLFATALTVGKAGPLDRRPFAGWWAVLVGLGKALPSLLLVVIVLGGILGGIFSATEASAIAVAYAALLGFVVYREIRLSALPSILRRAAITTAVVMLLVGCSQAMSWVLAYENLPQTVGRAFIAISDDPRIILLLLNVLLLLAGTFLDMTPAVLIFTPILLPVVMSHGVDPVHFGIIMIANLCIGLCTPPVGTCLFVGCGVGKVGLADVIRPLIPFFLSMVLALLVITFVPALSLWLPTLLGVR